MTVPRIAIPSKGRLRESVMDLLKHAGYSLSAFKGASASAVVEGIEFIEMRPRDAAAWLRAGRLDAAFISTDTALENEVEDWPSIELGMASSDLIVACREDAPFTSAHDLEGKIVATHLPNWTVRWFKQLGVEANVMAMGGSLEGVVAVGLADAIVDLRETGGSLVRNRLHAIEEGVRCQAIFTTSPQPVAGIADLQLRIGAALEARKTQFVLLHIPADKVDELGQLFPGLAAPTVLPLAGRTDLVAAQMVVKRSNLWGRLGELRALGASGIVALPTDAILE
ncbi:MAG: ATP phosphoribosyltransferase [Acidimicrobiales bacterium]